MALTKQEKRNGAIFLAIVFSMIVYYAWPPGSADRCPCVQAPSDMTTVPVYESADATKEPVYFVDNGAPVKIVKWGLAATRVRFSDGREAFLPSEWVH